MKAVPLASAALASVVHRFPDTIGKDAGRVVSLQHVAPSKPVPPAWPTGTPPLLTALDSPVGLLSSMNRGLGPLKVMISRVQALKRHARQKTASAITQSPEEQDASGTKIRH
jgi:hypothetical protein